jgi:hypothetical protein
VAIQDPLYSLRARLRAIEEQLRRLRNTSAFSGTGVHPNGNGGLDSDNFVAGTSGYSFKADGNAEFNDLTLRGGIIGNDALSSPVATAVAHADASDFSLAPGANQVLATATVPVPAGYTRAMVAATAGISAFNPTASSDYLYCVATIQSDATRGWALPVTVNASDSGIATQSATANLTGLSGSFTVKVAGSTASGNWNTSVTGNVANIDATVLFLR